ncbi:hypothetical protein AVEN_255706-1 [Araneus ventricosus]|uniref:Uncharacterized protein n=1 Tax=Araneus ventricosus TaxID=182803 RepID=A0A4Y2MDR3_ARAVE|nr:hypothetical protein AVEN_255706-1 [Araneus ventricosus]
MKYSSSQTLTIVREYLSEHLLTCSWNLISADTIRNYLLFVDLCETLGEKLPIVIEPPECMLKEGYEEWVVIYEDIALAATLADLEIWQVVCEQDQTTNVDDCGGDECVDENPPKNVEMRQALDISKRGG